MLHGLDPESCLKVTNGGDEESEEEVVEHGVGLVEDRLRQYLKTQVHSDKFVRRGPFWHQSRRFQRL